MKRSTQRSVVKIRSLVQDAIDIADTICDPDWTPSENWDRPEYDGRPEELINLLEDVLDSCPAIEDEDILEEDDPDRDPGDYNPDGGAHDPYAPE